MTSTAAHHPSFGHLRRQAKALLRGLQLGEPDAVARLAAHGPGLATTLGTTRLVLAREHGFTSWAQLKSLVLTTAAGGVAMQRPAHLAPAVLGVAESLPLADGTADAVMAVLTVHHWSDWQRGLAELVRVARRRVVLMTIDSEVEAHMWTRPGPPAPLRIGDRSGGRR